MRLSLKSSLMGLFGLLALLALGQGAASLWSLRTIHAGVIDFTTNWMPSVDTLDQIQTAVAEDRVLSYQYLTAETDEGQAEATQIVASVDADGPGLPGEARASATRRGRRLDETKPGSGLGLSIVTDLAGAYGGMFSLHDSSLGGLRAMLRLPGTAADFRPNLV